MAGSRLTRTPGQNPYTQLHTDHFYGGLVKIPATPCLHVCLEAKAYAIENGLLYMETSAKMNKNVHEIFLAIVSKLIGVDTSNKLPSKSVHRDCPVKDHEVDASAKFSQKTLYRDFPLIVEGCEIFINRGYLAEMSSYFSTLFCGSFQEGQPETKQVELMERKYNDVVALMDVIFVDRFQNQDRFYGINLENLEALFRLSEEWDIQCVCQICIEFLDQEIGAVTVGSQTVAQLIPFCTAQMGLQDRLPKLYDKIDSLNLNDIFWVAESFQLEQLKSICQAKLKHFVENVIVKHSGEPKDEKERHQFHWRVLLCCHRLGYPSFEQKLLTQGFSPSEIVKFVDWAEMEGKKCLGKRLMSRLVDILVEFSRSQKAVEIQVAEKIRQEMKRLSKLEEALTEEDMPTAQQAEAQLQTKNDSVWTRWWNSWKSKN